MPAKKYQRNVDRERQSMQFCAKTYGLLTSA